MSEDERREDADDEDAASGLNVHPLAAAALIGVASAGVYLGTRALARRNGRRISSIMATAITATDVASEKPREES